MSVRKNLLPDIYTAGKGQIWAAWLRVFFWRAGPEKIVLDRSGYGSEHHLKMKWLKGWEASVLELFLLDKLVMVDQCSG